MADTVTKMEIKVDLGCHECCKKIKKVLCKIPQIQDQIYDEKANIVKITVVCCCPEKIKAKICRKGRKTVKGIEILVPKEPKDPEEPKKPAETSEPKKPEKSEEEKSKQSDKPAEPKKQTPKELELVLVACPPRVPCREGCEGCHGWGPCYEMCGRPAPPPPCWEGYKRSVYDSWGCRCGCGGYRRCYASSYLWKENASGCTMM